MSKDAHNIVLVSAANGRTGRAVVGALAKRGANVRAFIRDESQQVALEALGAKECVVGDMLSAESVKSAVTGASAVVHIGPPMHPQEVEITQTFLDAAARADVGHFVYYSVMHPLRREVRHHRLKLDAEEHVIESGVPYTIIQPCRYMQHLENIWPKVQEQGLHAMPFDVDKKFNVVDLEDLAEAVAIVVGNESHHNATYELAGPEALSQRAMAKVLSDKLGRTIEARATGLDAMAKAAAAKGLPDDKIEQMRIMNEHYDRHGFLGNANVLRWLLGREPMRYSAYVDRLLSKNS